MSNITYLLKVTACIARITIFAGILLSLGTKADPVSITLYYSMACEHSTAFITKILYPVWKVLSGDLVQVDLIQYGNTEIKSLADGSWRQQCTSGLKECDSNKEMACAMQVLQFNHSMQMEYLYCLLNSTKTGRECSGELNICFSNIKQCKEGDEGLNLVLELGNKTKSAIPPIKGLPWITFNGVYDRQSHMKSWVNLTSVLCGKMNDHKPQICIG